ncbi:hypothetical protein WICMUC_004671 [Wickerhamomyces mucosus]|uniref:Uncharacterized protein n=1 Tax=Wickerhamomyces mucosus TaxID=1378264 RepID=A0A9P8TA96_9ASCO|nr:hypothetical protein WICMUC_004671 [Wickerhamomyces mucosus]
MSYHLNRSTSASSHQHSRPFSTNNPFRNASVDSSINDPKFTNWVNNNRSQASFSSDDEDGELFKIPSIPGRRPGNERTLSNNSNNSNSSVR